MNNKKAKQALVSGLNSTGADAFRFWWDSELGLMLESLNLGFSVRCTNLNLLNKNLKESNKKILAQGKSME